MSVPFAVWVSMSNDPLVRVDLQACFVLHHRPLRETSVIADLFTPDHGRLSVVARGARSAKSSRRALLQPFRPLLASWTGRGELKTLTGLEEQGRAVSLSGLSMACAYYLNELVLRLVPPFESNPQAFALYTHTLMTLPEWDAMEPELREFEIQLLESLGLAPDFYCCVDAGQQPQHGQTYRYLPESGIALSADKPFDPSVASLMISGDALIALAQLDFSDHALWPEIKKLMRRQLAIHLGASPLKSRAMLRELVVADPMQDPRVDQVAENRIVTSQMPDNKTEERWDQESD